MNEERVNKGLFTRAKEKFSNFIEGTFPEDDYVHDPIYEQPEPEQAQEQEREPARAETRAKKSKHKKAFRDDRHEDNVLEFPKSHDHGVFEIKALHITDINQIRDTIAILKTGTPCIVNVTEELDKDEVHDGILPNTASSQRAIDLLSGATLALDGYIEEFVPGKRVYIVAPANVKISKELREVIKSGIFGKAGGGRR